MRALIFAAGAPLNRERMAGVFRPADLIIAADGGAALARLAGLWPAIVVGDMDSVEQETLNQITARGARIERVPSRKNESDLELALDLARSEGAQEALLLGVLGGRADHMSSNLLLAGSVVYREIRISILGPAEVIHLLHPGRKLVLEGAVGDTVSLLALGGAARGVSTRGLEYPLEEEGLSWGTSQGVSNRLVEDRGSIWLDDGVLAVFHNR